MKKIPIIIGMALLVVGCATSPKMNNLSIGMTKTEVRSLMGDPASTASPGGGIEVLRYELSTREMRSGQAFGLVRREYFVKLENGKVVSYGRIGDFNSTKDPTINVNIREK